MIVLVDNYDSFSHNLYQLIGSVEPDVRVLRNDAVSVAGLRALAPEAVVLSPGPGRPAAAGICEDVVRELAGSVPILGVCLGHQAICEALGARIAHAAELVHGKASEVRLDRSCPLFFGLGETAVVGRYHSLAVDEATLPASLRVVARTADATGEVMAVAHRELPVYGLQFHPESHLTPDGVRIISNFVSIARGSGPLAHGKGEADD